MVFNNYYSCFYNRNPSHIIRTSLDDNWRAHFLQDLPKFEKPKSFKETVLNNCQLIYEQFKPFTKKVNLFFSGGTDSECMLKCFMELKIPVNPIIIIHKYFSDSPETVMAKYICKEYSLTPTIIDLDFYQFYDSGLAHELGIKYQTTLSTMLELLYGLTKIAEPAMIVDDVIMTFESSKNKILHPNETSSQEWFYTLVESVDGLFDRYEHITGIPVSADPYKYTPASWAAMITTPEISDIVLNYRGKTSSKTTKNIMMSRAFKIPYRIKNDKYSTGLQTFISRKIQADLKNQVLTQQTYKIPYHTLLDQLGMKNEF